MIKHITNFDFTNSFTGSYKDNFSYKGKQALFNYLEQYEDETGEQIELDPIALCCDYKEYDDLADLQASYPDIKDMQDLQDHTIVIPIDGTDGFIIQQF